MKRSGFLPWTYAQKMARRATDPSPSAQDCGWRLRRRQKRPKCNEALSRDLWPLDPFESAPMRATSSAISNCIPFAILPTMKLKGLAATLIGKMGRNSLTLKKFPCGFYCRQGTLVETPGEYYLVAMVLWLYSTVRHKAIT